MKRLICLIMLFSFALCGCSVDGERIKEPVTFYYIRTNYQKDMDQVIDSEVREASGHRGDLPYLLALYSMGPSKEELQSPLPRNTKIVVTECNADQVQLSLSDSGTALSDADFMLASACIALTCMEITEVQQVTVACADRIITLQEENLLLYSSLQQPQEETT